MSSDLIIHLTDQDFAAEALQADMPVLVDFWADWCRPCHALAPTIEALAEEYQGRIKVAKLDVDANPETPGNYGIMGIPTVILFRDGNVVERFVGVKPKEEFVRAIESVL